MAGSIAPGTVTGLKVVDVGLRFGGVTALNGVGLTVAPGEVIGLVGSNGSGKTSLINCISGAYTPQAGQIHVGATNIVGRGAHRINKLGVGRTFQHVELPRDLTCLDAVLLGRHSQMSRWGLVSYGLGIPYLNGFERSHRLAAAEALESVGCSAWTEAALGDVPFGIAKRVDLARALASDPQLLLLDEPAAGLNHTERLRLGEIISGLVGRNMTVLLVEHDMALVARVCPRLVVLAHGEVIFDGDTQMALRDAAVKEAFLGKRPSGIAPDSRTVGRSPGSGPTV